MAKVTGPLYSMTASGKIGNAMVHFGWKGINVVRQWLKPANPKSEGQGDVRQILGGIGRATRAIGLTSAYGVDAKLVAKAGNTFVSTLVGYVIKNYMPNVAAFEDEVTEYEAHTAKAAFDASAATLGLADFKIAYSGTEETFAAGLQLYMLAKYGIAKRDPAEGVFDRSPFDTALASWTSSETAELVADMESPS